MLLEHVIDIDVVMSLRAIVACFELVVCDALPRCCRTVTRAANASRVLVRGIVQDIPLANLFLLFQGKQSFDQDRR
jgi:hypothetical protein